MPIETFVHEALRGATRRRFISERLDNRVQRGVHLFIRQVNAGVAVIVPHEVCASAHSVPAIVPDWALQGDCNAAWVVSAPDRVLLSRLHPADILPVRAGSGLWPAMHVARGGPTTFERVDRDGER